MTRHVYVVSTLFASPSAKIWSGSNDAGSPLRLGCSLRQWPPPHWHTHFTPTSSSWINQVERFFALLAEKQIKRGAHTSVKQLIEAIEAFISQQNTNPKPLRWTKSADDILATIERFCRRTLDVHARTG